MPQRRVKRARSSDLAQRASRARLPLFARESWLIDYAAILRSAPTPLSERTTHLAQTLPWSWRGTYVAQATRPTNVLRVDDEGFAYLFDWHSHSFTEAESAADLASEDRLVAAFGLSRPNETNRNQARQRGWIGPTNKHLGRDRDKGHFIPHSLGGALEINLFVQLRDLNRGWSTAGKTYRAMESYCLDHPGTFFFNRPIYADGTAQPALLELGLLKADGALWVEHFEN